MYAALIVDLRASRRYPAERRSALQDYLLALSETLNEIFAGALERELRFNGGDELQGLFCHPASALFCLRLLRRALLPVEIHAGIGVGAWTVQVPERDTFYQDGPVYHLARAAIEDAKGETDCTALIYTDSTRDPMRNALLNGSIQLAVQNTAHQNRLALLLECIYPVVPSESSVDYGRLRELVRKTEEWYGVAEFVTGKALRRQSGSGGAAERLGFGFPCGDWRQTKGPERLYGTAHPRGAASAVAAAAGLTRQGVDTALRASRVYTERALALALLETLDGT